MDRIKRFVADQTGYPIERLTPETRLQSDLRRAGDDGEWFFDGFEREFAVEMSTLRYDEHFYPEESLAATLSVVVILSTSLVWPWLIPLWTVLLYLYHRRIRRREAEIQISDLAMSAELHQWTYDYSRT
jgi:hypothetical protein